MTEDDNDNKNTIVIQNTIVLQNNSNTKQQNWLCTYQVHTRTHTKSKSVQKTFLPVGMCALCFQQEEIRDAYICPNPKCCSA